VIVLLGCLSISLAVLDLLCVLATVVREDKRAHYFVVVVVVKILLWALTTLTA